MNVYGRLITLGVALTLVLSAGRVHTQTPSRAVRIVASAHALTSGDTDSGALAGLRAWDTQLTALARSGNLVRTAVATDTLVSGRVHERYVQRHLGVRVVGADLTRQLNEFGQAESIFGTYYPDIAIDVTPLINSGRAATLLGAAGHGAVPASARWKPVELVVLPMDDGTFRLTWNGRVVSAVDGHVRQIFVDARSGETLLSYDDTQTQSPASGKGFGVLGDLKKVSTDLVGGTYLAIDQLRPYGGTFGLPAGANITFDGKGNFNRFLQFIQTLTVLQSDIASDSDNVWSDAGVVSNPGIVDAHAYAGYTYDYYYKRFGRQGLDNANLQIWSYTNPVRASDVLLYFNLVPDAFVNAAYMGQGNIFYGVGLPSNFTFLNKFWSNLAGALDVVAHELSHGVTDYSSQLVYLNESGALNEAFSDMMGQSAQFFFNPPADAGASAFDWLIGEDVIRPNGAGPNGLRSLADPFGTFGNPDHYSIRFIGADDGGGVHTNSSIVNHMFYLAIMGGTNRVSGLPVTGVGFANRDQIERCIYRAFAQLMTSGSNFSNARAATIQAARDLFGTNSAAERALTQAWTAVGVN